MDLLTVFFDAASVEPDSLEDALSDNVVAGVLVVLEEAGHEDSLDMLRGREPRRQCSLLYLLLYPW